MTVPLNDLLVSLKWEEEGENIPAHAREQLLALAQAQAAVTQASGGGGGRNAFQAGWATSAQILQSMQRDAGRTTTAITQLSGAAVTADRAAVGMGRSMGLLRSAMTTVALGASATTGPVGRLVSGLLMFAGGGPLVLGVAAGVAVLAGAYGLLHKSAYEAAEAHIALGQSMQKTMGQVQATPEAVAAYVRGLEDLNRQLTTMQLTPVMPGAGIDPFNRSGRAPVSADATAKATVMTNLREQIRLVTFELERMRAQLREADKDAQRLLNAGDVAASMAPGRALALRGRFPGFAGGPASGTLAAGFRPPAFGAGGGPPAGGFAAAAAAAQATTQQTQYTQALEFTRGVLVRMMTPQQLFNQGLAALQLSLELGAITASEFDLAVKQLTEDLQKAKKGSSVLGVAIIGAVAGTIAAIMQGGSAGSIIGGILSTVGGVIGITNPLLGAGIAGLGQIASAAGSRGVRVDSYGSQALEQMRGIPNGPQSVEVLVMSSSTGEIVDRVVYELGRRTRSDGVRRIPLIVGAG